MQKDIFRFYLVGRDGKESNGIQYTWVDTTSFYSARKHFAETWTGDYVIICGSDYRNVKL
jgi:hypothetical protein